MKKKIAFFITLTIMTVITISSSAQSVSFADLSISHWAYNSISDLSHYDIITGYDDGSFKPDKPVTRAEWAKMLFSISGRSTNGINVHLSLENCGDLSKYHWASLYMVAVDDLLPSCIINHDTYYFPERGATREEVAVSLVKLFEYSVNNADISKLNKFIDNNTINAENKKYIAIAVENGILSGYEDNTIKAQNTLTRAEAAKIIYNCFNGDKNQAFDWYSVVGEWQQTIPDFESPLTKLTITGISGNTINYDLFFYRSASFDNIKSTLNDDGTFDFSTDYLFGKIGFKYNRAVMDITESNMHIEPQTIVFNIKAK